MTDFLYQLEGEFENMLVGVPHGRAMLSWPGVSSNRALAGLLRALSANQQRLDEVAGRSFFHPNGFNKVVLLKEQRAFGIELRLHVWAKPGDAMADIHNHQWSFASRILVGSFRQQTFEVSETGSEVVRHFTWGNDCAAEPPSAQSDSTCRLRVKSERLLVTGDLYELDSETLHRFVPLEPSLSLVFKGRSARSFSDVYRAAERPATRQPIRHYMPAEQLRATLSQAISFLERPDAPAPS